MGIRQLYRAWEAQRVAQYELGFKKLQAALKPPKTFVEASTRPANRWMERKALRRMMEEYRDVRLDGGVVATLLELRALLVFGVGGEWISENDDAAEWLNTALPDIATLATDIGTDAYFYGYSLLEILETEDGSFGDVAFVEPWTTLPITDEKGLVTAWEQEVRTGAGPVVVNRFQPEDLAHFKVMKKSGRDEVGLSLLGRGMDEAVTYRDDQDSIRRGIKLHALPKLHVLVGPEDGAVIDDAELRRVAPMFDNVDDLTKWVTGRDVEIKFVSSPGFDHEDITERDLAKLAMVFMLPLELTQLAGGEGLGTGFPARLRQQAFLQSAQAHQRVLGTQLAEFGRRLLTTYAGFSEDAVDEMSLSFAWNDVIVDLDEVGSKITAIGADMTVNERRELYGEAPLDPSTHQDVGESFAQPGVTEAAETRGAGGFGDDPFGGLFNRASSDRGTKFGKELASADHWGWERSLAEVEARTWHDDTTLKLIGFSEEGTPEFIKDLLGRAVDQGGPIFNDLKNVPAARLAEFQTWVKSQLSSDGWTITDMMRQLQERFGMDARIAEVTARSTTQNIISEAAEMGYRDRPDFDQLLFKWPSIDDGRDSDVCLSIVDQVPASGLPLEDLKTLVGEVAQEHGLDPRGWTPHPQCRRRPLRVT